MGVILVDRSAEQIAYIWWAWNLSSEGPKIIPHNSWYIWGVQERKQPRLVVCLFAQLASSKHLMNVCPNIPEYPLFLASVLSNNAYLWKLIGCAKNQNETLVKRRTAQESPRKTTGRILKSASVFLTVQPWKPVYLTYNSVLGAKNMFSHNSEHKRQG